MYKTKVYIEEQRDRFLKELLELLKIPSISADSAYQEQMLVCAEWVKQHLEKAGADNARVFKTNGHPIVYAEKIIDSSLPTVLVYGHYDVQPPDPLELWDSPPFEPVIKKTAIHPDGAIFARGACDDKGQFFMHVNAFEALWQTQSLPCNVKFLIEGEEEVGSEHLADFIKEYKVLLRNDIILISDTGMVSKDQPSITLGLRGLSYIEVMVEGPNIDLHSGVYGGGVPNPINILCQMIARLKDDKDRITIPGFYDGIKEYTPAQRAEMAKIPFDLEAYKESIGIEDVAGEDGYTTMERVSIRPSLDVNGIWGGYTAEGAKTVIASRAHAKISMRLISGQDPDRITKLLCDYLKTLAPDSVRVETTTYHGGLPYEMDINNLGFVAAKKALSHTFEKEALPQYGGGSIPIVSLFEQELGSKSILMGFGFDTDAIHSPNEHYGLFNYYKGIETLPYFYKYYTELIASKKK